MPTLTYNGNGNTGGTVPIDSSFYSEGESVTVLSNIGNLVRTEYVFHHWNTQANGYGVSYSPGDSFLMGPDNLTLYAIWSAFSVGGFLGKISESNIVIYNSINWDGFSDYGDSPTNPTKFTTTDEFLIYNMELPHVNNGGNPPGTFYLQEEDLTIYGPFSLQGDLYFWYVNLSLSPLLLPAGTYTVIDSNPESWSHNATSGHAGMFSITGRHTFAPVSNSYWDVDVSGVTESEGGEGKTTSEMKTKSIFSGWDFVNTWRIAENSSYPQFMLADFVADFVSGIPPFTVHFNNITELWPDETAKFITHDWDFGDGSPHSTDMNPVHTYNDVGLYTVILKETRNYVQDTRVKVGYILVEYPPPFTPGMITIKKEINRRQLENRSFPFVDIVLSRVLLGVTGLQFTPNLYNWDFGDGNNSTLSKPYHTYSSYGYHRVTVRVKDRGVTWMYVGNNLNENQVIIGKLDFEGDPIRGDKPLIVTFENKSLAPTGYQFTGMIWYFGDTGGATGMIGPSHTYPNYGSYDVGVYTKLDQI